MRIPPHGCFCCERKCPQVIRKIKEKCKYTGMEYKKNNLIKDVASYWKLDAKLEQDKYFYQLKEVNTILKNEKCYIIGRKGTGKTAICNYIVNKQKYNHFAERLSFKNFPFNDLYNLTNDKYTYPNQYITLWKYLIYSTICKMMVRNGKVDPQKRSQLSEIYPEKDTKQLSRRLSEWTSAGFGVSVLGNGGSLNVSRTTSSPSQNMSWIDKVDILEDIIIEYCDDSNYYIVFDELDEDYRSFRSSEEKEQYKSLLTSLFKAVQDVKSVFCQTSLHVMPVVFLRDDIYALLSDSDKNKWSDLKIELEWTEEKIKNMLAFRLSRDLNMSQERIDFKSMWDKMFERKQVSYGAGRNKKTSPFDFICHSTQMRPRDFIKYIQGCCEHAMTRDERWVSPETIKHVDRAFSNYLRDEILDEVFPLLPEINNIFQVISNVRKPIFSFKDFSEAYGKYLESGTVTQKNINYVLDTLYNFSVIGNQNRFQPDHKYFKYLHTNMTYNIEENIVLHRGLLKSLQIY